MWFADSTRGDEPCWTEYRTPSGRWSKIKHNPQELEFGSTELRKFFTWYPKGQRMVYKFNYLTEEVR